MTLCACGVRIVVYIQDVPKCGYCAMKLLKARHAEKAAKT